MEFFMGYLATIALIVATGIGASVIILLPSWWNAKKAVNEQRTRLAAEHNDYKH